MSKRPEALRTMLDELATREGMPTSATADIETAILTSSDLRERMVKAAEKNSPALEHISVAPPGSHTGGYYAGRSNTLYIAAEGFRGTIPEQRIDYVTGVMGHEIAHALLDKGRRSLSSSASPERETGMGDQYTQLCAEERGTIMAMQASGASGREIARVLERASSTIARELRRNGVPGRRKLMGRPRHVPGYDAVRAGERARRLRRLPRQACKLRPGSRLWRRVHGLLKRRWSPQQVAAKLQHLYPDRLWLRVSHETIYTAIHAMPRGQLKREVIALLRRGRSRRGCKPAGSDARGHLPDLPSIRLRPPEANERLLPGHWEGDLIVGAYNRSAVGVLVCRHSLFLMLAKMEDTTSLGVLEGFRRTFAPLPGAMRQTLTYDQGKEMARHRRLSELTGLAIYFADPHSPWQRGICENTNGLLRQYFPKGTDLSVHTQRQLDAVAWEMNTRPRKTLGWRSPAEVFFEHYIKVRDGQAPADALGG